MRALSIRQPYAELILRGIKTAEYRSRPTKIIGQRFFIYASKTKDQVRQMTDEKAAARCIWSNELAVPGTLSGGAPVPRWMMELAEELILGKLPTGVIVGSAVIEKVSPMDDLFAWHLTGIERTTTLRKPTRQPQPVWFTPF